MEDHKVEDMARAWTLSQPLVAAFISVAVPNFHDAQDLLQEVAAASVTGTGDASRIADFNAWVLGIARHKIADFYRKQRKKPVLLDDQILDSLAAVYAHRQDIWALHLEALDKCIARVRGRAREVLELRYKSDLTSQQIAQTLGSSPSAVRMTLLRVRDLLRGCIERRLGTAGGGA